jgi:hypothetical protein
MAGVGEALQSWLRRGERKWRSTRSKKHRSVSPPSVPCVHVLSRENKEERVGAEVEKKFVFYLF